MGKAGKIVIVIIVVLMLKILFNWTDRKWAEDCEDRGGTYKSEGIGEGCYGAD